MQSNPSFTPRSQNILKTPQSHKLIDDKIKHQLTELYHSMRFTNTQSFKSLAYFQTPNNECLVNTISYPITKKSKDNLRYIDRKKHTLPNRSEELYEKLYYFYKLKYDDGDNEKCLKKGLVNRLCRRKSPFQSRIGVLSRSLGPKKKDLLRITSLLNKNNLC